MKIGELITVLRESFKITRKSFLNIYLAQISFILKSKPEITLAHKALFLFSFIIQLYNLFTYYYFFLDLMNEGFVNA